MSAPVKSNSGLGFTLVELLIAVVIMSVGLLGLLQAVNVSLNHNMTNQLRNEAVVLADERMTMQMAKPFVSISTVSKSSLQRVEVYNGFRNYSVFYNCAATTNNTKNVQIDVAWKYKGARNVHSISSLVSKSF